MTLCLVRRSEVIVCADLFNSGCELLVCSLGAIKQSRCTQLDMFEVVDSFVCDLSEALRVRKVDCLYTQLQSRCPGAVDDSSEGSGKVFQL